MLVMSMFQYIFNIALCNIMYFYWPNWPIISRYEFHSHSYSRNTDGIYIIFIIYILILYIFIIYILILYIFIIYILILYIY